MAKLKPLKKLANDVFPGDLIRVCTGEISEVGFFEGLYFTRFVEHKTPNEGFVRMSSQWPPSSDPNIRYYNTDIPNIIESSYEVLRRAEPQNPSNSQPPQTQQPIHANPISESRTRRARNFRNYHGFC